jgi:chromosome segregation ATPase
VTGVTGVQAAPGRPRPERAIDARRRDSTTKVAAVQKAVNLLGRTGAPMTRAAVSQLAGVSRSFTYENEKARMIIAAAQARTDASAEGRMETATAQQEASWRERALNAEDQVRKLRQELTTQRRLVGDLIGQLREPDGTWIEHDRDRLRKENDVLLSERNHLVRERDDLQRKLNGARANISRLAERRVTELFPDGPGRTLPS